MGNMVRQYLYTYRLHVLPSSPDVILEVDNNAYKQGPMMPDDRELSTMPHYVTHDCIHSRYLLHTHY
jgi:hypothetical protein